MKPGIERATVMQPRCQMLYNDLVSGPLLSHYEAVKQDEHTLGGAKIVFSL